MSCAERLPCLITSPFFVEREANWCVERPAAGADSMQVNQRSQAVWSAAKLMITHVISENRRIFFVEREANWCAERPVAGAD